MCYIVDMENVETTVLNYRIIVEPKKNSQTGKKIYVAFCPKLEVSDWGNTIDQAINHIEEAIECHLESLLKHHKSIPNPDQNEFVIATTKISFAM